MSKMCNDPYLYWLAAEYELRRSTREKLLEYKDSAGDIYNMKDSGIEAIHWLTEKEKQKLIAAKKKQPQRMYEEFMKAEGRFTWIGRTDYPDRLRPLKDAPFALFYYGELPADNVPSVGIVGARGCSAYGRAAAESYGAAFASRGVSVISGMASGIDSAAQFAALQAGGTSCAVLGCGIDICYPSTSRELYRALRENGCVLSEYPLGMPPRANHFPARNRIISGLSDKLLVVEAKEKSGSLITADMALEHGKDVFAVPGRNADILSRGCNELIHQGAGIALDPESVLLDMGFSDLGKINNCKKITNSIAKDEKVLYSMVDFSPKSLDEILGKSSFSEVRTMELLVNLQLKGYIREVGRNRYVRSELR